MRKMIFTTGLIFAVVTLLTFSVSAQDATPAVEPASAADCIPAAEMTAAPEMTVEAEMTADASVEMFTIGDDGTITVNTFPPEFEPLLPGASLITFVNALSDDTNVSFYRDDVVFSADLISSGINQTTIPVDAGTYSFSVYDSANPDAPLAEQTEVDIIDSYYYIIAAVDGSNGPQLVIHEATRAEYALATGQLAEPGTLIEALNAAGLCYLLDAIESAGLTETLSGEGPYTLFVPADFLSDEFAVMGGDVENVLLNHVVEGDLKSFDLTNLETGLTSLAGNPLDVQIAGNAFTVNGFQVLSVNIPATNGTIHIIDGILMPETVG